MTLPSLEQSRLAGEVLRFEEIAKADSDEPKALPWPEGNALLPNGAQHREARSKVPDYNTVVTIDLRG